MIQDIWNLITHPILLIGLTTILFCYWMHEPRPNGNEYRGFHGYEGKD